MPSLNGLTLGNSNENIVIFSLHFAFGSTERRSVHVFLHDFYITVGITFYIIIFNVISTIFNLIILLKGGGDKSKALYLM